MKANLFLPISSAKEALQFYVNELALFKVSIDYGLDNYLLSYKYNDSFGLNLVLDKSTVVSMPLFELIVADCTIEFERIVSTTFLKGGLVTANRSSKNIFEYPLGKNFLMKDPFGHKFLISEYYIF